MDTLLLLAQQNGDASFLVGGGMVLVFLPLGIAGLVLWLWALVDAIRNPALSSNERLIWVLVIILTNWIGALLYLLFGRGRGVAT